VIIWRATSGICLAEWFTDEPAWATALGEDMAGREAEADGILRERERVTSCPFFLLESGACTPLFHYRYRINTMENVQDIVLTAGGWLISLAPGPPLRNARPAHRSHASGS
jgi:MarR-like DNA-binding transcriptional regulator SgrR of sgrS sRNA